MEPNIEQQGHRGPRIDQRDGWDLIDCIPCGFRHVLPLPDPVELERLYREEYFSKEVPQHLPNRQADQDWWDLVYAERYDSLEALLGNGPRRVLDLGCGAGWFLHHGRTRRDWQVLGVEPSRLAAEFVRGLGVEVVNDFFSPALAAQLAAERGPFGAIQADHVLEHVPDPAGMLRSLRGLLAPEGILCLLVPND
jgi:SAM-dependent methyltransferase